MKASYMFPTGTYNIILTRDEIERLLDKGLVNMHCSRIPCHTGRAVWNSEEAKMDVLDEKDIFNDLRFMTDCSVADMEPGLCNVQYVNIIFDERHRERYEEKQRKTCETCKFDNLDLTTMDLPCWNCDKDYSEYERKEDV